MRKIALAIFILVFGLFFAPNNYLVNASDIDDSSNTLEFETIYTDNILEYMDLTNISKLAISEKYIAYSLNNNSIDIFNIETKSFNSITNFNGIKKMRFIGEKLLVATNEGIKVIDIISSTTADKFSLLPDIDFTNIQAIDFYTGSDIVYIGYVSNNTFYLNEYNLNLEPKTNPIKQVSSTEFENTYLMAVNDANAYIVTNESNPKMYTLHYEEKEEKPNSISLSLSYQVLDTFYYDDTEYILSFTKENLYLFDTGFNEIDKVTINPIENVTLEITDMDYFENKIYVADKKNTGAIQSYSINLDEEDILQSDEILICSKSKSTGRFNTSGGLIISGNNIFVADKGNNNIHIISDGKTTYINDFQSIITPHSPTLDENLNLYFVENNSNNSVIHKYRFNGTGYQFANKYDTVSTQKIGYISSSSAYQGVVYLLDYTNNTLLAITDKGLQIKATLSSTIALDSDSIIRVLNSTNQLVVYCKNKLYLLNTSGTILDDISTPIFTSITTDYYGVYGLSNDTIYSYSVDPESSTFTKLSNVTNEAFTTFSDISFDIANRVMFAFDSNRECLVKFTHTTIANPFNFYDFSEKEAIDSSSMLIPLQVKNNPIIYQYPHQIGMPYNADNTITTCLGIEELDNEYRVLFNFNKVLTSGFINKNNVIIEEIKEEQNEVIAINKKVPIYKYPTMLRYNNQAIQVGELDHKSVITVTSKFPINIDGKVFYTYEFDGKIGYIFNADIVLNDDRTISYLETSNATIKAIGVDDIEVYSEDLSDIVLHLNNNDRIYVAEYSQNGKYTKICYTDKNQNTIEGYILTEYIQMDKLDNTRIILIVIIAVSVLLLCTIVTAYLVIRKKK